MARATSTVHTPYQISPAMLHPTQPEPSSSPPLAHPASQRPFSRTRAVVQEIEAFGDGWASSSQFAWEQGLTHPCPILTIFYLGCKSLCIQTHTRKPILQTFFPPSLPVCTCQPCSHPPGRGDWLFFGPGVPSMPFFSIFFPRRKQPRICWFWGLWLEWPPPAAFKVIESFWKAFIHFEPFWRRKPVGCDFLFSKNSYSLRWGVFFYLIAAEHTQGGF